MAPKKTAEVVPAAPVVDSNPFGAFINVKVNSGELHLVEKEKLINTHLVLSYSNEYAPLSGTTTEPHEGKGVYLFNFDMPFRQEASLNGLNRLLNSTVKLAMHDSATGSLLASTLLDMTPLATHPGLQGYEYEDIRMDAADASVVQGAILHSIVITLTKRDAPAGLTENVPTPPPNPRPSVSGARPSISGARQSTSGARPSVSGAPPTAIPVPILEELPEPVFFSFLSGEDADESNVLEVVLDSISPVPQGLISASNLAKEGKAPGKISVSVALILPSAVLGAPLASISLPPGSIEADGSLSFGSGTIKALITGPQAKALLANAEEGLPLCIEVARYLTHDQLQDNASWEHYHSLAILGPEVIAPLSSMGVKEIKVEPVPLIPFTSPDRPDQVPSSVLPVYTSSNPKAKPIETVPAEALNSGLGGWAGSQLGVTLRLTKPLVAPWSPPPPATITLDDLLVANHIEAAKATPPSDPAAAFAPRGPTQGDALSAYKELVGNLTAEVKALSLAKRNDEGLPMNALDLNVQLECSGRYEAMKKAIAEAASRVAIERYRKSHDSDLPSYPSGSKEDGKASIPSQKLNQELLAVLVHATPATIADGKGRLDDLSIAKECELMGRVARAQSMHQRRILALSSSPHLQDGPDLQSSSWYDYGAFCLRARQAPIHLGGAIKEVQGDPSLSLPQPVYGGRAEQCFREGLMQNPGSTKCAFGLAASLLHQARVTDPLYLQEATETATALLALLQSDNDSELQGPKGRVSVAQASVLLALCHAAASDDAQSDALFSAAMAAEDPSTDARLSTATLLMELGLSSLAASAIGLGGGTIETNSLSSPDLFLTFSLTKAHAIGTSGVPDSYQEAIDLLAELLEDYLPGGGEEELDEEDEEDEGAVRRRNGEAFLQCSLIARTLGDVHFSARKYNESIRAYRTSRDMSRSGSAALGTSPIGPPELYANLARAYLYTNHKAYALEVFKQASAASNGRSAWSWVGAGACLLGVGSKEEAIKCFDEALALDPEDPETWARLAMASFEQSREAAGACLKTAVRYGLEDPLLLSELSSVYGSKEGGESGRRVASNLQNMIHM